MDLNGRFWMNYCPLPDDSLCNDLKGVVDNGFPNIITGWDIEDPSAANGRAKAILGEQGYQQQVSGHNASRPSKGSAGHIELKDREVYYPGSIFNRRDPADRRPVPAQVNSPWAAMLAHELGHVEWYNKGVHPRGGAGVEQNSMFWGNRARQKLGDPYVRIRYVP